EKYAPCDWSFWLAKVRPRRSTAGALVKHAKELCRVPHVGFEDRKRNCNRRQHQPDAPSPPSVQSSRLTSTVLVDVQVDTVVWCTGYKYSFPFLEGSDLLTDPV
ncbi:unnamed protein product, partial [Pylaiella littoralis]